MHVNKVLLVISYEGAEYSVRRLPTYLDTFLNGWKVWSWAESLIRSASREVHGLFCLQWWVQHGCMTNSRNGWFGLNLILYPNGKEANMWKN